LRLLAAWREREARRRDRPRSFLLKEELLLALATRQPKTVDELRRLPALDAGRSRDRDVAVWLDLLAQAAVLPAAELPEEVWRPPTSARYRTLEERLRVLVQEKAVELALPPEILASRRVQGALLRRAAQGREPLLPRELQGWRRPLIGDALAAEAEGAGACCRWLARGEREGPRTAGPSWTSDRYFLSENVTVAVVPSLPLPTTTVTVRLSSDDRPETVPLVLPSPPVAVAFSTLKPPDLSCSS
ncbi:MAG TPA: HRDC domain-containing protein, partial [Thermoanaerobaculia bacterium]